MKSPNGGMDDGLDSESEVLFALTCFGDNAGRFMDHQWNLGTPVVVSNMRYDDIIDTLKREQFTLARSAADGSTSSGFSATILTRGDDVVAIHRTKPSGETMVQIGLPYRPEKCPEGVNPGRSNLAPKPE